MNTTGPIGPFGATRMDKGPFASVWVKLCPSSLLFSASTTTSSQLRAVLCNSRVSEPFPVECLRLRLVEFITHGLKALEARWNGIADGKKNVVEFVSRSCEAVCALCAPSALKPQSDDALKGFTPHFSALTMPLRSRRRSYSRGDWTGLNPDTVSASSIHYPSLFVWTVVLQIDAPFSLSLTSPGPSGSHNLRSTNGADACSSRIGSRWRKPRLSARQA
ncbi:hypothetical protein C8J56DRAFT_1056468 [Mycena floridula]|nr:hypothetical protein C8J56DRAFT_1056468 [Mycena floridula]